LSSIRKANILLISAKALANEIAKNLVLAGIGTLTIIDPEVVTEMDLGAQFFVTEADIGKNVCWWQFWHYFTLTFSSEPKLLPPESKS
jgi:molybdopterin/thiamine biosynthesis adenylyltransferase